MNRRRTRPGRRRSPVPWFVAGRSPAIAALATVMLLTLLSRCGSVEEPPAATSAKPSSSSSSSSSSPATLPCQRLLHSPRGEGVAWDVHSDWHSRPLPTSRPESGLAPLARSTFDGASDPAAAGWLVHESFAALVQHDAKSAPLPVVRDGRLELPARASVACTIVPAPPLTPMVLTVHVKQPDAAAKESRLFVVDLNEELSHERDPVALAQRVIHGHVVMTERSLGRDVESTTDVGALRVLRADVGARDADGFETWRFEFMSEWSTRSIALAAFGSEHGPVAIDEVTLFEVPARALLGLPAGAALSLFDLPRPWENVDATLRTTKVRFDWESRHALLLTRGAVARCRVARPTQDGQLDLGLAIVREDRLTRRGPIHEQVVVRVDGTSKAYELTLHPTVPSGWLDLTFPIAAAGKDVVELELRVLGEDDAAGPLVAVSDPQLFARVPSLARASDGKSGHDGASAGDAPNLLVLSLDTLRADRLGRVVNGARLTPNLDALAAQSLVATNAFANASYTLPSHVSLFTSQIPSRHGVFTVFDAFSPQRSANFAQVAAQHGYATAAFTSGGMLNPEFCGIDLGFDRFGEVDLMLTPGDHVRRIAPLRDRPEYNAALEQRNRLENTLFPWLASRRGVPFVALVHTYLIHNYQPEPAIAAKFTHGLAPTPLRLTGPIPHREWLSEKRSQELGHGDVRFEFVGDGEHEFTPARDLPWIEATYDATVAQADRDVGKILAELDRLGLASSTIVVVTADHGEEMLEHGDLGHARSLFDEILRVPLIVHVPGLAPRRIDESVESIDVAPTLLSRLGLPIDSRMDGADLLVPKWEPRAISIHEGVEFADPKLAGRTLRCARARSAKLVVVAEHRIERPLDPSQSALGQLQAGGYFAHVLDIGGDRSPVTGLFDLVADPREQRDLADSKERTPTLESRAQALFDALARATETAR